MLAAWRQFHASLPGPFLGALLLALGFMGFIAWEQSHWWQVRPDYSFGWLVPVFVLFVLHDRWPRIIAELEQCQMAGSPRATGSARWALRAILGASLLGGASLFLLGSFYRAQVGASQPGTLAITLGMVGILPPLLILCLPDTAAPTAAGFFSDARLRLARWFIFPVLVWLISAPLVSVIEMQLSMVLLRKVVSVVAFFFDLAGVPIEQRGNVLVLPPVEGKPNHVGVAEACSGIRSLTACLFSGSFLAAVFVREGWKKIILVVAALLLAFATNLGRSLFLTIWAYHYGHEAIAGPVHDIAGYAVLAITVAGLLCIIPLLNLRLAAAERAPTVPGFRR